MGLIVSSVRTKGPVCVPDVYRNELIVSRYTQKRDLTGTLYYLL